MARIINGINGPFIGKVGSVIGYSVNGKVYMKGLYGKRTKPAQPGEIINRKKFRAAQLWLHPLVDFLRAGFKGYNDRCQGFVAAKSWLMRNAMTMVEGEPVIDPAAVKLSHGDLPLPENIRCEIAEPATLLISWKGGFKGGRKDTRDLDQVMAVAYQENVQAIGWVYGPIRGQGEETIKVRPGVKYHVYVAFIAADRSRQSDSVYLGEYQL